MQKLRKTDYVILAVLLAVVIGIVCFVLYGAHPKDADTASGEQNQPARTVTYQDYNGKKIGILTGTNMEAESFKFFPDSEYFYYDGYPNLNTALMNGTIDAYLGDEPALKCIHAEQPQIDYIKERLTNNRYSFAFRKDEESETKLRDQLNEFLRKSNADGTIAEIDAIWFGVDESKKVVDMSDLTGENGTIHVVTTSTDEPFSYIKDGKHVGYDIDVAVRFCREYGYALEIGDVDFQARIPALASGKYEFTTSMNVTPEREEAVMFSDPVSSGGIVVAVRAEDLPSETSGGEPSYTDYDGKKIGIITGTVFEAATMQQFPNSEYLYYNNNADIATALAEGKIDGYLLDEPALRIQTLNDKRITYLKKLVAEDNYAFGFQKDTARSEKLQAQFNEMLAEFYADGTMDRLNDTWFGTDESKKVVDTSGLSGERINVVVIADYEPFSYIKGGKLVGYAIDLVAEFCRRYGYEPVFENVDNAAGIPGLVAGKYDLLATNLSVTEERKESIDFSDTIYSGGLALAVRAADVAAGNQTKKATLSDFNGKQAGIIIGSMHESVLKKRMPDSELSIYNNYSDMTTALLSGYIDYFLMGEEGVEQLLAENSELDYIDEPMEQMDVGVMFPKSEKGDKIRAEFDDYLTRSIADGTVDEIYAYWTRTDLGAAYVDTSDLIGENGTLIMATSGCQMPQTYIAEGKNAGSDIDIAARFCREYGYGLDIQVVDFAGIIPGLKTGMYDFAISNIIITDERKESVNFSVPYYHGSLYLVGRKSDIQIVDASGSDAQTQGFFARIRSSFEKNFIRESRWKLIVQGIGTTCLITVLSVIFGSILAFLICLFRRTDSVLAGKIADLYVKLLQGTPMVVLLMILYYVIFGKSGMSAIWVAVIGFSLNFAAYVSETLRSGIDSIDGGQREAALALGYSEHQAFFRFIFPQAAVRQLPVYRGEIISLLKNTAIVGYIAIQDLTKMSAIIRSRTYEAFFPLIVTAVIYFILAWIITLLLKLVLKQIDPRERKRTVKGVTTK